MSPLKPGPKGAHEYPIYEEDIERFTADFMNVCRLALEEKGLTITEWAKMSGVTRQSIHNYLSGKGYPKVQQLIALAGALGLTVRVHASRRGNGTAT